ncbi:MAG TPA: hypothetical protein GX693_04220 [Firmicutes bacterium]|nr:hypothetical protein [Bacillota bacterium]
MAGLQEMIIRARFVFANSPQRLEVFRLVNGRLTVREISLKLGRSASNVGKEIKMMRDLGIINVKLAADGNAMKKGGAIIYDKNSLLKHVSKSYFQNVSDTAKFKKATLHKKASGIVADFPALPSATDILQIAKEGETHIYEFKSPGTELIR